MSHKLRCIFDTNTVISDLLFKTSLPGRAFYFAMSNSTILASIETVEELVEVINRRKFDKYLTTEEREEFLDSFLVKVELMEVLDSAQICRDSKDDKFLNLASSGRADYIVTGDDDLLVLGTYGTTQIINPRDFLDFFTMT